MNYISLQFKRLLHYHKINNFTQKGYANDDEMSLLQQENGLSRILNLCRSVSHKNFCSRTTDPIHSFCHKT